MRTVLPCNPFEQYRRYKPEINAAIQRVLESGYYILGDECRAFEKEFADYVGVNHAISTGSGTEALHLALRAYGIVPGDEVITVSHTAVATVAAIEMAGAVPVFVDVDETSYTMNPAQLERAITNRTKAIVPVHLYGHPANMDAIQERASTHQVKIIEDCAQAHGAMINGKLAGALGDAAAFSFYPTKNIGALGDAGMILSNDPDVARKARLLRQYGWEHRNNSIIPGWNSRMDELQAAMLRCKLNGYPEALRRRREIAAIYNRELAKSRSIVIPLQRTGCTHCYHQYVIRHPQRDALRAYLKSAGIQTLIHYPQPIHRQPAYNGRIKNNLPLPITEKIVAEILSLPLYPELDDETIVYVCDKILEFEKGNA